ncbi:YraN family protein [Paenibacillus sp.]|jgi:putative endonuclease|uniref:YraN family protein n=1 Tax=Paenibacillus sp. TaxID=58172 RepID=UPI0028286EAD|nr:YraN family protein [Paenibacillus sp.]MDR0270100.1 YraN family protein [Paenibacillus sp.]
MAERLNRDKDNRREKGAAAEQAACDYLVSQGYAIKDRNWRCRSGELDIVAELGRLLVIIEVRSRSGGRYGTAVESVDFRKTRQVRSTALTYLHYKQQEERELRFDVIAIEFDTELHVVSLQHIEGAF